MDIQTSGKSFVSLSFESVKVVNSIHSEIQPHRKNERVRTNLLTYYSTEMRLRYGPPIAAGTYPETAFEMPRSSFAWSKNTHGASS